MNCMKKMGLKSVVWKEGDRYVSQCLNVEVSSFGSTKKEAISNLHEALELYFQDRKLSKLAKVERPDIVSMVMPHA